MSADLRLVDGVLETVAARLGQMVGHVDSAPDAGVFAAPPVVGIAGEVDGLLRAGAVVMDEVLADAAVSARTVGERMESADRRLAGGLTR